MDGSDLRIKAYFCRGRLDLRQTIQSDGRAVTRDGRGLSTNECAGALMAGGPDQRLSNRSHPECSSAHCPLYS